MGKWLSFLLGRRYVITVQGDPVPQPGEGGPFLILPNHPALVDPLIVYSRFAALKPRPLVETSLARAFGLFFGATEPIVAPDSRRPDAARELQQAVEEAVDTLARGRSVIMWPGERLQDNGREVLRGQSGVYRLLRAALDREVPLPELFLVRTEGLWGSRFSRYFTPGRTPNALGTFVSQLPAGLWGPLLPKRHVRLVLRRHATTTADCATVERINGLLSLWYDAGPQAATLVPLLPGASIRYEPARRPAGDAQPDVDIAPALALLSAHVPVDGARPETRLLEDLGIDSRILPLVLSDMATAIGKEPDAASLTTVAKVAEALQGCGSSPICRAAPPAPMPTGPAPLTPVPAGALHEEPVPEDVTPVLEPAASASDVSLAVVSPALLRMPPLLPVQHAMTRQGTVTDVSLGRHFSRRALMGLSKAIGGLLHEVPSGRVGVSLPCGIAAMAAFVACLDSTEEGGRVPVWFDCGMDAGRLAHCARQAGVTHVLTTHKLEGRGLPPDTTPVYLEQISKGQMRRGYASSLWGFAGVADVDAPAAVVFTSGSEGVPKGVCLTHRQLMTNLRAALSVFMGPPLRLHTVSVLCGLPPYHVLGLSSTVLLPLTCGVPAVTVSDPADYALLAHACRNYGTTLFVGTPTQLRGMLQAVRDPLPLRWAVVGGEVRPPDLEEMFRCVCPGAVLVEGYGATECSPVVSVNVTRQPGSVGKALPGLEYALCEGQLYVRGESVFSGYLDGSDPRGALPTPEEGVAEEKELAEGAEAVNRPGGRDGESTPPESADDWYPTGDLFEEDAQGFLYFKGRLRRIAKRGEEMISLAALEEALGGVAILESAEGRLIAVGRGIGGPGELNARLREAGFMPPWKLDATLDAVVPLLSNGTVDYKMLRELV